MVCLILMSEVCAHAVPFVRDRLDTPDPEFLLEKLVLLAVGIALYLLFNFLAYKKAVRSFEKLDL